jgi:hypothetical protein
MVKQRPQAKVPRRPTAPLILAPADIVEVQPLLWRTHRKAGGHVTGWNELRRFGPLASMRFDPHPLGEDAIPRQSTEGVLYAATTLTTSLAESFQSQRLIDTLAFQPHLTAWTPTRPLRLLDLTGDWALRNGAAHSLATGARSTCRAWARAIRASFPELDGLWSPSTMTGEPMAVLFNPAQDSFPDFPEFSRPLAHPVLRAVAVQVAETIHYRVL